MTVATGLQWRFDNSFVRDLPGLFTPWQPQPVRDPALIVLNEPLARELGLDPAGLSAPDGVQVLAGNTVPEGAASVAQAYAGHQFGGYSPRLGDGRAFLLGEVIDTHGNRRDLHLKGSGRTIYSRGADGRAALGPMLREYIVGEGMYGLGVPTTRALSVVFTGEHIARETGLVPGAVLVRVAASHLRVGSFQYARAHEDETLLRRLALHAIARHHPQAAADPNPYLALLRGVIEVQASLVAQWMSIGFVHGVLNTDNVTISGETIDYGPCAFLDGFNPTAVFSSIDQNGRYAYQNQPAITLWNLSRFAEALLPLLDDDEDQAVELAKAELEQFAGIFEKQWTTRMLAKIGLPKGGGDLALVQGLLGVLAGQNADWTSSFRALADVLRGEDPAGYFFEPDPVRAWVEDWREQLQEVLIVPEAAAAAMDRVNPIYIPRNHLVEAALAAAEHEDFAPLHTLIEAISHPFDKRPGLDAHAQPAPESFGPYRTFCGT
jgi:uncharacterized protein YdiU (UPF0061 family)